MKLMGGGGGAKKLMGQGAMKLIGGHMKLMAGVL